MNGALSGIKIVEAASYVTGPFASQLLADMGAEVIKIEEPKRGDPFRGWGERNYAATFCSLNRNKKSITVDLRTAEGREVALKLAARADALIENFEPGDGKRGWATSKSWLSTRRSFTARSRASARLDPIATCPATIRWVKRGAAF
jgi:formyl-CoA transferase